MNRRRCERRRVPAKLFRRRVGRGHQPQAGAGHVGPPLGFLDLLGDSEIQQPDGAILFDQDVRRLQVAMNDAVAVRVASRFAHRAKQLQAVLDRALMAVAEVHQRPALDVFHDEPRRAVVKASRVVETRDRGVVELCERALFGGESLAPGRRERGIPQELDRDLVLQVVALGQMDDAAAALTKEPDDAIRPETLRGQSRRRDIEKVGSRLRSTKIQHRLRGGVLLEHRHHVGEERLVAAAFRTQEFGPVRRGQIGRGVKERLRPLPPRGIERAWLEGSVGSHSARPANL